MSSPITQAILSSVADSYFSDQAWFIGGTDEYGVRSILILIERIFLGFYFRREIGLGWRLVIHSTIVTPIGMKMSPVIQILVKIAWKCWLEIEDGMTLIAMVLMKLIDVQYVSYFSEEIKDNLSCTNNNLKVNAYL